MKRSSRATGLSATTRQTATGFWREPWDRRVPRSQFLVQEDHAVFEQPAR